MPGVCEVCSTEPSKYRCPTCSLMSCSLACTQSHKIYCAPKPEATNNVPTTPSDTPAGDLMSGQTNDVSAGDTPTVQVGGTNVATIASSAQVQALLSRYPELRSQLSEIFHATEEDEWQEWYTPSTRGRPHGRGGRGGPSRRSRGAWTAEKGFNRGLGKVRKFRQDCEAGSETGVKAEAFMEFLALVNKEQ
ncbi:Zinc finger HIT-type domain-containing protein [Penicillium ucsense]|uniref:Zinc finger HIT-type domain-containing protein n=1 Tax=Penicillium ucsense TaxID=2839758 RepID=A0A8J8WAW2_9EURO|nr:Zinc finger HIT-type domain-containing protein [Penicillium ucsense]KAF7736122.1 Zinc finger HIT-type domain-containing protein [Penicillium ucsense]